MEKGTELDTYIRGGYLESDSFPNLESIYDPHSIFTVFCAENVLKFTKKRN